jgi:uncharacterized protein (DUF1778 family)
MADREKKTARMEFRLRPSDREAFEAAAEREGFGGNLTQWALMVLRRAAKEPAVAKKKVKKKKK